MPLLSIIRFITTLMSLLILGALGQPPALSLLNRKPYEEAVLTA
jgi:hypothetical protein